MAARIWPGMCGKWIGGGQPSQLRAPLRGGDWLDGPDEAQTFHIRMQHTPQEESFCRVPMCGGHAEP